MTTSIAGPIRFWKGWHRRYLRAGAIIATLAAGTTAVQAQVQVIAFPDDAGVIDVTDPRWGAIPSDGRDDTQAIQRIFDQLSPTGRIVYFPEGLYEVSDQLVLKKNPFVGQAADLDADAGWVLEMRGERTTRRAAVAGSPDDIDAAPRLRFSFEAIAATRALRLDHRVPAEGAGRFAWRLNGGDWSVVNRNFGGEAGLRVNQVVATGLDMVTGENVLEIAALSEGLEIDAVSVDYLGAYLANTIIQGASRQRTRIRLANGLTNSDGAPFDKAVLRWEEGVEQFFRTAVRNITFDVGVNNPEADGLRFHGNNQATISDVKIVADRTSGDVGLDLVHSAGIGPIWVNNLRVEGFDIGIHTGWQNGSRTFEEVSVQGQRQFGWVNEAASQLFIRKFSSLGGVTAFENRALRLPGDGNGRVVMIDSTLRGQRGADAVPAIRTRGEMFVSDVATPGYGTAVLNTDQRAFRGAQGQDSIDGQFIGEWWSDGAFGNDGGGFTRLFADTPDTTLRLSPPQFPFIPWDDPDRWAGPHDFVYTDPSGRVSGVAGDGQDDTASLQAAIDSGASTVYLPHGEWTIDGTIELRGNVRRLIGTEGGMASSSFDITPVVVIGPQGPRTVVIERLANFGFTGRPPVFEHASSRRVAFSSVTGLRYRSIVDAPGDVFLRDTVGDALMFKGGQSVWARQLDIEEDTTRPQADLPARIVNDGANVWVLGYKTEQQGVHALTRGGGVTEILGNHQLNTFGNSTPQYITEDATFSVVSNFRVNPEPGTTYGTVVEVRGGDRRTGRIEGTGYSAISDEALWNIKGEILIDDAEDGVAFSGDWAVSSAFPRGHIGEGFAYAAGGPGVKATYTTALPRPGRYAVSTRWIGDWFNQDHSRHATNARYDIEHAGGVESVVVDQDPYSDGWFDLGTFRFTDTAVLRLSGEGANGTVNTDGLRLRFVGK